MKRDRGEGASRTYRDSDSEHSDAEGSAPKSGQSKGLKTSRRNDASTDDNIRKEYEILGFKNLSDTSPSEEDIKRNYKKMALKFHPDKNEGIDTSALFNSISDAYTKICKIKGADEKADLKRNAELAPVCKVCTSYSNESSMVTCGNCLDLYHAYCLSPRLKKIPDTIWFCEACLHNQSRPKSANNSILKQQTEDINKKWNEKIDNGFCLVCLKDDKPEKTLVCDGCLDQYHTYCLMPKLKCVPAGDWFCRNCNIKWNEKIETTACKVCCRKNNEAQTLICDGCLDQYHMYCLSPKLKTIPKGDWFCHHCQVKGRSKIVNGTTYIEAVSTQHAKSDPVPSMSSSYSTSSTFTSGAGITVNNPQVLNVYHINNINCDLSIYDGSSSSSSSSSNVPPGSQAPRFYKSSRSRSGFRTLRAKPVEVKSEEDKIVNSSSSDEDERYDGPDISDEDGGGRRDGAADTTMVSISSSRTKAKKAKHEGKTSSSSSSSGSSSSNRKSGDNKSSGTSSSAASGLMQDCDFGYYTYVGVCKWNDIKHPGNFRFVGYFKDSKSKVHLIKGFYDTSIEAAMARDDYLIRNPDFMKLNSVNTLNFVRNKSPVEEEEGGGEERGERGSKDSDGERVCSIDCDAVEAILENSNNVLEDMCSLNLMCICSARFTNIGGLRRHLAAKGCMLL